MLRREHEERRPEDRVRTRREDGHVEVQRVGGEQQLRTLRPPDPRNNCTNGSNCDQNDDTINVVSNVGGVCNVTVVDGDIGTNSNMKKSNNAQVCLDAGSDHRVFHYDLRTRALESWADPPGAVEVKGIVAEQVTFQSKDGTDVRMFLLYKETTAPNAARPTILWGYGGFKGPSKDAPAKTVSPC